jgi:hypothetical protein
MLFAQILPVEREQIECHEVRFAAPVEEVVEARLSVWSEADLVRRRSRHREPARSPRAMRIVSGTICRRDCGVRQADYSFRHETIEPRRPQGARGADRGIEL